MSPEPTAPLTRRSPVPGLPDRVPARHGPLPGFFVRLSPEARSYLAVNGLLIVIWFATGAGYFWPMWPMLGWGLGLVLGGGAACRPRGAENASRPAMPHRSFHRQPPPPPGPQDVIRPR